MSKIYVDFNQLTEWEPAHSDLYHVYFEGTGEKELNAMMGGKVFPATSVETHLFQVQYEEVRLIDGLTLPFPAAYEEHGYITISFQENVKWQVHKELKAWADMWNFGGKDLTEKDEVTVLGANPNKMIRRIVVEKIDLGHNLMAKEIYGVLPPDSLRATNSDANDTVSNSFTMKIVLIDQAINSKVEATHSSNGNSPSGNLYSGINESPIKRANKMFDGAVKLT